MCLFQKKGNLIYAFEPQQDNYLFLLDQIKIRGLKNVKTYNIAISNFNGSADFYNRESHGIHSLGVHNKGKVLSSSKCEVIKLNDFWKDNINDKIGLLKIDVEVFETDVLKGASYLLENNKIDAIIFEFSPKIHKMRGMSIDAPIQILNKYNYNLFTIDGKEFVFDKNNYPKLCDLIAKPSTKYYLMNIIITNLPSTLKRRNFQHDQLSKLGLNFKLLNAISIYKKYTKDWQRPLQKTEVARYFSHRKAWNKAIEFRHPAFILENGALLSKCVPSLLKELSNMQVVNLKIKRPSNVKK